MALRLMLAFLLVVAQGQQSDPAGQKGSGSKNPYVERSEKQFAFYPGGKLEISAAAAGNVKIVGWQSASIRAEVEKVFFYLAPDQAQALSKRFPVHITNTQTLARISTSGSDKPGATMEVNLLVYVPREKTDLDVKMIKGDLSVASVSGWAEATLEEGNVEARDLAGYFSAITKLGDLTVELSGPRWTGHSFTAATRRGSVELKLPLDYSAQLQLETRGGKISVDYPDQIVQGEPVPFLVVANKKIRSLNARIGEGGAPIRLTTLLGDIALKGSGRER
jgi:DUF4097 and DUF4098 domain-containing protein YvlB